MFLFSSLTWKEEWNLYQKLIIWKSKVPKIECIDFLVGYASLFRKKYYKNQTKTLAYTSGNSDMLHLRVGFTSPDVFSTDCDSSNSPFDLRKK